MLRSTLQLKWVALSIALSLNARFTILAQEARVVSEITGFVQNEIPGGYTEFAPLFYPPATAFGPVSSVTERGGSQLAKASWSKTLEPLPDPPTSFIWPMNGPLGGVPLRHAAPTVPDVEPYDFWTQNWAYSRTDGRPHTTLLAAKNLLVLKPYFLIEEMVGPAVAWETGTELTFAGRTAVVEDGVPGKVWKVGDLSGPDLVIDDALGPYRITLPPSNSTGARWNYQGTLPLPMAGTTAYTRQFLLVPGQRMMLFRPDGVAAKPLFLAAGKLNLTSAGSPAVVMAASLLPAAVALADKIHFRDPQTSEEQTWFYKSGTAGGPAGWYRLPASGTAERVPDAEVAEIGLRAGEVIHLSRSASKSQGTWKLALPMNTFVAATVLPVPATSNDKDRMPDFWETVHFPNIVFSSVKEADDLDKDGYGNLAELYLGGNPAEADHPARLTAVPLTQQGGNGPVSKFKLSFLAGTGLRYQIETKLAGAATWTLAVNGIVGTGTVASYDWLVPEGEVASLDARLFRVVGLGPVDSDLDGLYDIEESYVGTDPAKADTDEDDMKDGDEVRTKGKRNALDYWDNAIFKFVVTGDRQVGAPGSWCRDPIKITVTRTLPSSTSLIPLPKNLSVNFVITRGVGGFATDTAINPVPVLKREQLTFSADMKTGQASCYVRLGTAAQNLSTEAGVSTPIQGLVSVRVDSDPSNLKLYNESFLLYPSTHLTPPSGMLTWLRADRQTTLNDSGNVVRWGGTSPGAGALVGNDGPTVGVDKAGRKWLNFTGTEALLLDDMIPASGDYSLFLNAWTTSTRTATALPGTVDSGAIDQFYILSGALPPGISGLPDPYSAATYRSFGISLGVASAGLFDIGSTPRSSSPNLMASQACSAGVTDGTGVLLGLVTNLMTSQPVPALRVTGRNGVAVQWPVQPTAEHHYLPRMIGGRSGGPLNSTSGSGMFVGKLRDLLVFNRSLTPVEAQRVEDIILSEKPEFAAAGYLALKPGINRDPGSPANDKLPDWWERTFWGALTATDADDADSDGTSNLVEHTKGLHPRLIDTDGDTLSDTFEMSTAGGKKATSPASWDTDNDLIPDNLDKLPLDPANGLGNMDGMGIADGWDWLLLNVGAGTDSDGDGLSDLFEVAWLGTDATVANVIDADGDGMPDHWEAFYFADLAPPLNDPNETSSYADGDGISDLNEFLLGLNPRVNDLHPDSTTGLTVEPVVMDAQGRVKSVGTRNWVYDEEGNIVEKTNSQGQ